MQKDIQPKYEAVEVRCACGNTFTAGSTKDEIKKTTLSSENQNAQYVSYLCQNCGAEIVAEEQTAATFCVYCGNAAILKNKLSGSFAPDKVIPEHVTVLPVPTFFSSCKVLPDASVSNNM